MGNGGLGEGSRKLGQKNYTRPLGELYQVIGSRHNMFSGREMAVRRTLMPGAEAVLSLCLGMERCGRCHWSLQVVVRG